MRRTAFRNISICVVALLAGLAIVQGVWVMRLYRDTVEDFYSRVQSAIYKSIYQSFITVNPLQPSEIISININLDDFDLHFKNSLLESEALQPHNIEVLDASTGRVVMRKIESENLKNPTTMEANIDDAMFILRVSIEVPYRKIWNTMWGLILSSGAIIILLSLTFIYLIRILFRQKELEQMRRDLTHNITHELKTPISVAYTANDALRNFSADNNPTRRERYLEIVALQLTRLSSMVERILAISVEEEGRGSHNPEPIELKPLLEQIVRGCQAVGKRVTTTLNCPDGAIVTADKFHLRNILQTIIDNSVKYSNEQVEIIIDVEQSASTTEIAITDNGIGIAERHQQHIFDKFYRVPTGDKHDVRGYGLGLYYARTIVERHGGTIAVQSRKGEGTTITITLPSNEQ